MEELDFSAVETTIKTRKEVSKFSMNLKKRANAKFLQPTKETMCKKDGFEGSN